MNLVGLLSLLCYGITMSFVDKGGHWLHHARLLQSVLAGLPTIHCFMPRRSCIFHYWHVLAMLICNPAIVLHHARIGVGILCFVSALTMFVYVLVVYCIALYLILSASYEAWHTIEIYKLSMHIRIYHRARRYVRDVLDGQRVVAHILPSYLLICCLWSSVSCVLSHNFL